MALRLAEIERMLQAAEKKTLDMGVIVGMSIVDGRGDLLAALRLDEALWRTMPVSRGKAYASAAFGLPSGELTERANNRVMCALQQQEGGLIIPQQAAMPIKRGRLMLDFRVLAEQSLNERRKQRFAPLSDIGHKREETEITREWLLGNAPVRAQPTPQARPEPFHRRHMDFTKAIAIVIACELAPSMVDTRIVVSPGRQAGIPAVLSCLHTCPWNHGRGARECDCLVLHSGPQLDHHLTTPQHHPQDG
jgi:uncharacterized protein GlcG (DUF336 family)